jgi:mannitol operon repressor
VRPEDLKSFTEFVEELRRESDRGLALIGAAFIDEKLAETLQAFFCTDGSELLFGKNAPLGSFSARIETCHALALIEDIERNDCDYIRRIRNEFAHKVVGLSFSDGKIKDLCGNLKSEPPEPETPRAPPARFIFENAVIMMASRLFYRAEFVAKEKRSPKVWADPEFFRWRRTSEEALPTDAPFLGAVVR